MKNEESIIELDLKCKSLEELEELALSMGQKKFAAGYLFSFMHEKRVTDLNDITPLSKEFRQNLVEKKYFISSCKTVETFTDPDGTIKYLYEFQDGERIESVLLEDEDRKTLCISTQVGCDMDCTFCATGKLGYKRNLTAGEILSQVYSAVGQAGKINNIVYMGMGEPLLNYDAVVRSMELLNHAKGQNIGQRHITLSTCGIPEKIVALADEKITPRLAISLNAPSDSLRNRLMPVNKEFPLDQVLDAVGKYQQKADRRVTFEYLLICDVNDSVKHARMLVEKIRPFNCNVNLIEYNPHPGCKFKSSPRENIKTFASVIENSGIETVIRYKRGRQIKAACGQLGSDLLGDHKKKQSP